MAKFFDHELEQVIIGQLILEWSRSNHIFTFLKAEHFHHPNHISIVETIISLHNRGKSVDLEIIKQELEKKGLLVQVGGLPYLVDLVDRISTLGDLETHVGYLTEFFQKRCLKHVADKIASQLDDESSDLNLIKDMAEQGLYKTFILGVDDPTRRLNELFIEWFNNISVTAPKGIPSGYTQLDYLTMGFQPSDLIILAARPSMGKTGLVLGVFLNSAIRFQVPVGIFSLEMSKEQLTTRAIASESDIPGDQVRNPALLGALEMKKLEHVSAKFDQAPIYIDDTPGITLSYARSQMRKWVIEKGVKMIAVDYIQLMRLDDEKGKSREAVVSEISRGLKGIAKELGIPIIALSQLSRAVETRGGDKRPLLSDLRESGSIEQDADIVIFIYRAEYYKITQDENGNSTLGLAEIIIAKHRNGPVGTINLKFRPSNVKFTEWN